MHSNPVEAATVALLVLVLYVVMTGGLPIPSKFSLRALLIATTLLAVVLGLIAYAARS